MVYFNVNEYTGYNGDGSENAESYMAVRFDPDGRELTADEMLDRALAEHHARQLAAAGQPVPAAAAQDLLFMVDFQNYQFMAEDINM